MSHARCPLQVVGVAAVIAAMGLLCAPVARGQARIPDEIKARTARLSEADVKLVAGYVANRLKELESADNAIQRAAREALIVDAQGTPEYQDEFVRAIADGMRPGPGLLNHASLRVRLNAAIVVQGVAGHTRSARLEPAVQRLVATDQPEVIRLWGVRAAKWVIDGAASVNSPSQLLRPVMAAVGPNPLGAIVEEAYDAFIVDAEGVRPTWPPANSVPFLLELFEARVKLLASRGLPDPEIETGNPSFGLYMTRSAVWNSLTKPQQLQVAQLFNDYFSLMSARFAQAQTKTGIVEAMKFNARCIVVLGQTLRQEALVLAAQRLNTLQESTPVDVVDQAVKALLKELKAAPDFRQLKDPPTIADRQSAAPGT